VLLWNVPNATKRAWTLIREERDFGGKHDALKRQIRIFPIDHDSTGVDVAAVEAEADEAASVAPQQE